MKILWSDHAEKRLDVMIAAGVPTAAMERLAVAAVENRKGGSVAVGVKLDEPVSDPTNRNWRDCDVVGAIMRPFNGDMVVTTLVLSRTAQFGRGEVEEGMTPKPTPEEHFLVERVVLR